MANLVEDAGAWPAGVYQLETTDPVLGGPPNEGTGAGIDNIPHKQLADRTAYLRDQLLLRMPASAVLAFAVDTPPSGWLECDGAAISRTSYDVLFAAIGTAFGVGDGSTTFDLPDLRGEFVRGWDHGRGIDLARSFGSSQMDALQRHNHELLTSAGPAGTVPWTASLYDEVSSDNWAFDNPVNGSPKPGYTATTADEGVSANGQARGTWANETRPRNISLMFCIKY